VYVNNDRRVTGLKVNDGLWHHVVVCWTSVQGMWQIFLDGVLVNSGSLLAADTAISGNLPYILYSQYTVSGDVPYIIYSQYTISGDVPYILYSQYTISANAPYIPIYLPYDVG